MRRLLLIAAFVFAALLTPPAADAVWACPMCQAANEADSLRPRAYMYSILFMLAVPATIFTGFSIGFYRLSKKQRALLEQDGDLGQERDSGDSV